MARFEYSAATHIGKVRQRNEDSHMISPANDPRALLIIADGMGGYRGGDIASAMCVQIACNILKAATESPAEAVIQAYAQANREILEYAATNEFYNQGIGSTMTLAVRQGDAFLVANVGDSRAYLCGAQGIRQITHDHSLVQLLIDQGKVTLEEALTHPYRNIITKSVGMESYISPDLFEVEMHKDEVLLLCSDGLHGCVRDDQLQAIATQRKPLGSIAHLLVSRALEQGGGDNITVVLARCKGGA